MNRDSRLRRSVRPKKNKNSVESGYRREPMGDNNERRGAEAVPDALKNDSFGRGIKAGGRFIQDQNLGLLKQRPRDGEAGAAPRKLTSARPGPLAQAVRQESRPGSERPAHRTTSRSSVVRSRRALRSRRLEASVPSNRTGSRGR